MFGNSNILKYIELFEPTNVNQSGYLHIILTVIPSDWTA